MSSETTTLGVPRFGPHDRESFFDAQRRNRRATWRMSFFCFLAAFAMGIPLTLALSPLIYFVVLVGAEVYNYYSPLPKEFWIYVGNLAHLAQRVADAVFNHKPIDPETAVLGSLVFLLPGILLSVVFWLSVLALFRRGGVGGALLNLAAREPNQSDLKELQLADVVQEMAIAAGIPAPHVRLVDDAGANAAVIGTGEHDAQVVISRRLLDVLSRDELEGVLAHLIASVGNGDLSIAFTVTSIFEAYGLIETFINSPFGPQARTTIWHILRFIFGRSSDGRAREAETVAALLARNVDLASDDIDNFFQPRTGRASPIRKFLNFVFLPILITNLAIRLILWFFSMAMLEPAVALLWRTRQYLSDASAVQLMRNADGLASALRKLNEVSSSVPGGAWASHLFIVSPARSDRMRNAGPSPEMMQAMTAAWANTAQTSNTVANGTAPSGDFRSEVASVQHAAMQGDPQAIARLYSFGQAMAAAHGETLPFKMPDPADILAARNGDRAAIARLRAISIQEHAQRRSDESSEQQKGLQGSGFLSFHPPLKRRLTRLERMGAHVQLPEGDKGAWKITLFASVFLAPLMILFAGACLFLIGAMIMLSMFLLTLWLGAIHGIFSMLRHH
jgi:Zn-dependent protease with chaperone function